MDKEILENRISNIEKKIERKENTIKNKYLLIDKKYKKLTSLGVSDLSNVKKSNSTDNIEINWIIYDIEKLQEDIKNGNKEIDKMKTTLESYKLQLKNETKNENIFLRDIPKFLIKMQNELVGEWDKWDTEKQNQIKLDYKSLGYIECGKKYNRLELELIHKSKDEIHKDNVKISKSLILDFYNRVKHITGDIIDWNGIYCEQGTRGVTVLNGFVKGEKNVAEVKSIIAGGYNVQRLHIRVLVK